MIPKIPDTGAPPKQIIFITGTDTGVGKTLLSGLLLYHLRRSGRRALAVKPFCSGGMDDVKFLGALQNWELRTSEICPFYFPEPVAPWVAARMRRRKIELRDVLDRVRGIAQQCDCLIVEGAGGLLVPLGEGYSVADLICGLDCAVMVVARNRLGTINHTLLSVEMLRAMEVKKLQVVLMNGGRSDVSSRTNERVLRELLAPVCLFAIPFLGPHAVRVGEMKSNCKKVKKNLARLLGADIV